MLKKRLSLIISVLLAIAVIGFGGHAFAESEADDSALQAVLTKIESYDEADYTAESYAPLEALYTQYSAQSESMETQEEIDAAVSALLEATSQLKANLRLSVTSNCSEAVLNVAYGETDGAAGTYTVTQETPVTVTAPQVDGYRFDGWFETGSRRMLSTDFAYTFTMAVKTSLCATYYKDASATLTFASYSGQIFSVTEKTAQEWAQTESLDDLIPASVPYRYGYANGRWVIGDEVLSTLGAGESVTVIPQYDEATADTFSVPEAQADTVNLKLHYRYDAENTVGTFVMTTAIPQDITPEAIGMLFYYKSADGFDPAAFDVNTNNKMQASQYDELRKDQYITNMRKLTAARNWAVRGYAVYTVNGQKTTVYSNQVNIVNTVDLHEAEEVAAVPATCTENGNSAGTYCDICGQYFGVEEVPARGHDYEAVITDPTCTEEGFTTYTCTRCGDTYINDYVAELGHDYEEVITEPTCTEEGYTTYTCRECGYSYINDYVAELGHDFEEVITEPTCTEEGYTTYTCKRCDYSYVNDYVAELDHDYDAVVTPPTCMEGGYTTHTCSRCGDTYTDDYTDPLGHAFGEWVLSEAPSCTEAGTETRTCQNCDTSETREVPALGHDYDSVVTAPTCTQGGYTTHTCSRCGDTYTDDYTDSLGHAFGEWTVITPAAVGQEGERRRTCSRCGYYESETIPALTANIEVKLPHTDSYLYRAGNANNIALGSLFKAIDETAPIDSAAVTVTLENVAGSAGGTFTANTTDWTAGTVKFTGNGVMKLTVKQSGTAVETLYLEIVTGTNYAEGATLSNITSNNAVLLGDVDCKKIVINNGKTLYGNGFSVTDSRTDFSMAGNSYIQMNGGGSIDNAKLLGEVYPSLVTSGQENQYYAPGVWITGDANIYNSYVSETKNAVQVDAGTVTFENSTFAGGAMANVDIGGGDVTFKNCVTKTTDRGGLKGLGVRVKTASCKIHLLGSFTQYNLLKKSDLPSAFSSVLSSAYSDANFAYTNSGNTYVNMGIFFFTDSGAITQTDAEGAIDDRTTNSYAYLQKSAAGYTATVYTAKASMGSEAMLNPAAYDETVNGQYPLYPAHSFDYTNKNYIAKTEGSNRYCYYDSTTKSVQISFEQENSSSKFDWDPMILTATKLGNTLPYTVTMNGTDYTNQTISFTEEGDYTVTYTYTDPYNYDKDTNTFNVIYTKTVDISVKAVAPDVQTYLCAFNYDGAAGNYDAKKVIGTDSKTYVMPDVSATSTTIGKTTVAGQTVYYPIVTVNPTTSNGNTAYSSGKGYYFAPVFSELHIRDYNQETGAQQYEYSKSTNTWPHAKSATTGPDTNYFTCASGEKTWSATSPYARSMNSQYYKYGSNSLGVCYTSTEIEKDNAASTHLVQYHYVSNDGTTYYYYIQYKFGAMTYKSCVAEGTLVTMADGTHKPIEDVKVGDMVMTWSLWNGCYEAQPVVMHWYHGTDEWQVLTLHFSDGTEVRMIKEHGFFDADLNNYVYLTTDNVEDYLGDRFIQQNADGTNTEVELTDYEITHETVGSYSIQTAFNENFMVENMLSMTGEDYRGRFEYFTIGDGMKYDPAAMQADIEKYGLYDYEEFAEYLTPEQFAMFNGQYFKVLVGKGVLTKEDIFGIISDNL